MSEAEAWLKESTGGRSQLMGGGLLGIHGHRVIRATDRQAGPTQEIGETENRRPV